MSHSISRRAVLGAAAAVPATAALPTQFAEAAYNAVRFSLNATVLDGGEQVTSVTLHAGHLGEVDPASVRLDTFSVHAKATSPVPVTGAIYSEYDMDRDVTGVHVDRMGNITLDLYTLDRVTPGTLGFLVPEFRNVELVLTYTIKQKRPVRLTDKRPVMIHAFQQGRLLNPEVDAFSYAASKGGLNYRLFTPKFNDSGDRPLVVWLHGGGEGGLGAVYTNETPLRANRGALGFATDWGQDIFGGAYVVAPQCESAWMDDGARFAPQIKALIDELVVMHGIDPTKVHVLGCSNGGYMTLKMEQVYPDFFASGVPICPGASEVYFTEAELSACSSTPNWFVHSKDDDTLDYEENTGRAAAIIDGEIVTPYDNVTWNGISYPGHWSWIYVGHNDPSYDGENLYQWMARQSR